MGKAKHILLLWSLIVFALVVNSAATVRHPVAYSLGGSGSDMIASDALRFDNPVQLCVRQAINDPACMARFEAGEITDASVCLLGYEDAQCQTTKNKVSRAFLNLTRDVLRGASNQTVSNNISIGILGLSTDSTAPTGNEATCPSLVSGNGLDMVRATTIAVAGQGNYSLVHTWTATGGATTVWKVCAFNGTSNIDNTFMASANFTLSAVLGANDQITANYSLAQTG